MNHQQKKEDNYILASSSFKFIHFIIVCVLCEKKSSSAVCSFFSRVILLLLLLRKMVRFLCPIHHLFSELTLQHYTKKNLFCRVPFFVCECLSKKMKKRKGEILRIVVGKRGRINNVSVTVHKDDDRCGKHSYVMCIAIYWVLLLLTDTRINNMYTKRHQEKQYVQYNSSCSTLCRLCNLLCCLRFWGGKSSDHCVVADHANHQSNSENCHHLVTYKPCLMRV